MDWFIIKKVQRDIPTKKNLFLNKYETRNGGRFLVMINIR